MADMEDPLAAALAERERRAQAGGQTVREIPLPNGDTGRIVQGESGLSFTSPGYSTSDPEQIRRILGGATPAETQDWTPVVNEGGRLGTAGRSGLQGLTFGFGDEIVAAGASLGPGTYDQHLQAERARLEQGREEYPVTAIGSEIAGAAATGIAAGYGNLPRLASTGQKARAGAMIGAGEGAIYGFGSGEGGVRNRAERALWGGVAGAGVGAAAPVAMDAAVGFGRRFVDPVAGALNMGNQNRAQSAVVRALMGSDQSIDDLSRYLDQAQQDGLPANVADAMGVPGQRALAGAARQPGPGRTAAVDMLNARQRDQGDRIAGYVQDAFADTSPTGTAVVPYGSNMPPPQGAVLRQGGTAQQVTEGLTQARGAAANLAYDAARANAAPVDVRGALAVIDDRLGPMANDAGIAGDGIDATLSRFRQRLAGEAPGGNVELSDFGRVLGVKQDVQDAIGAATRAGRNNEARELTRFAQALDAALEEASTGYRAANDGFREASRVIEAVDTGATANRPGVRTDDFQRIYGGMTPEQQRAARLGYQDRIMAQIENARPGNNMADPLRSTRQSGNLSAMARDPARLTRQIEGEQRMFETRAGVVGGSQTAELLADQAAMNGEDIGIIANLLSGRVGAASGQVMGRIGNAMTGNNEGTREQIVRMLLSSDPRELAQAVQRTEGREAIQRTIESLLRGGGREPAVNAIAP